MKKIISVIALILAVMMLSQNAICASQELRITSVISSATDSLDYSSPYSTRAYISPSDLLTYILSDIKGTDVEPCASEAEFLDDYFSEYLVYSTLLPDSNVSVSVEADSLTVSALPCSYEGKNGKTVSFIPIYAVIDTQRYELELSGNTFCATVQTDTDADSVSVVYGGSLSLARDVVNKLLNFAFNEATRAVSSSESLAQYTAALSEYRLYLRQLQSYEIQLEAYEQYVQAKEIYDEALALYQKNQEDIVKYNEQKAIYDSYVLNLNEYNTALSKYNEDYAKYETQFTKYREYITNVSAVRASLSTMESLFIDGSRARCLYEALQNSELVVMFEKYQSILTTNFGVPKSDITKMRQSSDKLNALLQGYATRRDISEEAAFAYYKQNYSQISALFNDLYDKMSSIMTPTIYNLMCGKLELEYGAEGGQYKKWRIKNVLSHIYRICLCLDDERTAEETWSFYADTGDPHVYYFSDLLDQNMIITDANASDPSGISWVSPVELPIAPTMPTKPTEVAKPIPPVVLPKPTEPVAVVRPTAPTPVDEPTMPDDVDHSLLLSTKEIQVSLSEGDIAHREEESSDFTYDGIEVTVTKAISHADGVTVTAYGTDGQISATSQSIDSLPIPEAYSDDFYDYVFSSWSLSPLSAVSAPQTPTDSISVYPIYEATPRKYDVTFVVNGHSITKQVDAGSIPTYDDIPTEKAPDSLYEYEFSTWAPALQPVRKEMTYEAQYTTTDRIFKVNFVMEDGQITLDVPRGEMPSCPIIPKTLIKNATLYEFLSWDKSYESVSADTVYTAVYKKTVLASTENGLPAFSETATEYSVEGSGSTFDISALLRLAKKNGRAVSVTFSDHGARISLDYNNIANLITYGARKLVLLNEAGEGGRGIGFCVTDAAGNVISIDGDFRISIPHAYGSKVSLYARSYFGDGLYSDDVAASITDTHAEIVAECGAYYKIVKKFTLTLSFNEFGNVYADSYLLAEGERVSLHAKPHSNYVCGKIVLKNDVTGETIELSSTDGILMPAYDATLAVEFVPLQFTVTFVYHGQTQAYSYTLGQMPEIPQIPLSFTEDGVYYTFIGWSSPVTTVSGDAVYTAKYYSVPIEQASPSGDTGNALKTAVIRIGIPIAVIFIALVGTAITLTVVFVKRRKKKRALSDASENKPEKDEENDG